MLQRPDRPASTEILTAAVHRNHGWGLAFFMTPSADTGVGRFVSRRGVRSPRIHGRRFFAEGWWCMLPSVPCRGVVSSYLQVRLGRPNTAYPMGSNSTQYMGAPLYVSCYQDYQMSYSGCNIWLSSVELDFLMTPSADTGVGRFVSRRGVRLPRIHGTRFFAGGYRLYLQFGDKKCAVGFRSRTEIIVQLNLHLFQSQT